MREPYRAADRLAFEGCFQQVGVDRLPPVPPGPEEGDRSWQAQAVEHDVAAVVPVADAGHPVRLTLRVVGAPRQDGFEDRWQEPQ